MPYSSRINSSSSTAISASRVASGTRLDGERGDAEQGKVEMADDAERHDANNDRDNVEPDRGRWPIGEVSYEDDDYPLAVRLEAFTPFIPLNAADSGLPATVFRIHVTNRTAPTRVGNGVSIAHSAVLHGCTVEDDVLIGIGAVVMDHAVIGAGSLVAAGALVTPRTVIPPNSSPARWSTILRMLPSPLNGGSPLTTRSLML